MTPDTHSVGFPDLNAVSLLCWSIVYLKKGSDLRKEVTVMNQGAESVTE